MGGLRFPCPPFAYAVIASSFFVARYGVKLMPGYQFRRVRHFGSCDDGFGRSGTIGSRSTPRGTGNTHVQQGACHHSPPDGPTGGRNIVETMPPYRRRLSRGTGTVHAISHLIVGCSRCGTRCQELIPTPLSIRVNVRVMWHDVKRRWFIPYSFALGGWDDDVQKKSHDFFYVAMKHRPRNNIWWPSTYGVLFYIMSIIIFILLLLLLLSFIFLNSDVCPKPVPWTNAVVTRTRTSLLPTIQ